MEESQHFGEKEEPPSRSFIRKTSSEVSTIKSKPQSTQTSLNTLSHKRKRNLSRKIETTIDDASLSIVNSLLFPISDKVQSFRKKYYPEITNEKWNDWHWQVSNRIRTIEKLERIVTLSNDEKQEFLHTMDRCLLPSLLITQV